MTPTMTQELPDQSAAAVEIAAMLTDFHKSVDSVQQTSLVGEDGLLIHSVDLDERAYADRLAAMISGLRSIAEGGAQVLGKDGVRQVLVEFYAGYLLVARIPGGYDLGVAISQDCDLGAVGYEVALLVERLGAALNADAAAELKSRLPD
jgi:uncharacterized protein